MEGLKFNPEQIERQMQQLRLIYEPTGKYRFATIGAYYPKWNANNPEESLVKIAEEHRSLYSLIMINLPRTLQPKSDRPILNDYSTWYITEQGDKDGYPQVSSEKKTPWIFTVQGDKDVYPQVPREEITTRLDDINATVKAVKAKAAERKMNPVRTISAFGTTMLTMVSLHGIIGGKGHGRASLSLMEPITVASGFPYLYYESPFMKNGNFDLEMAYRTVFENNIFAALRMYAGHLHMNKYGDVPRYLRDPKAIWSPTFSTSATFRAAYDLASDLLLDRSPVEAALQPVDNKIQ